MSVKFKEGQQSFAQNNGEYLNPYKPGTSDYNQFEDGWKHELRLRPASEFISARYAPNGIPQESAMERKAREISENIQKGKSEYLKAKGG